MHIAANEEKSLNRQDIWPLSQYFLHEWKKYLAFAEDLFHLILVEDFAFGEFVNDIVEVADFSRVQTINEIIYSKNAQIIKNMKFWIHFIFER